VGIRSTTRAVFQEAFALKEMLPALITFVTAALLLWRKLEKTPFMAAVYSFLVVVFFKIVQTLAALSSKRGKIEWKLGRS